MNIIFLDFDGVINNNKEEVTLSCIQALKFLIHCYEAKIVVISSNLKDASMVRKQAIIKQLNHYEIWDIDFINPNLKSNNKNRLVNNRILGIIDYLKKHKNVNYIILDDEYAKNYKKLGLNAYQTNMWKGLQWNDLAKITFKTVNLQIYDSKVEKTLIRVLKK